MQPYTNPNFYNWQQQFPYAPQPTMPQTINGRMIDSIDSVTANDVPMQGISVFPKNDLSEVYVKSWQPNGTILTRVYAPRIDFDNQTNKLTLSNKQVDKMSDNEVTGHILERLDSIENTLETIVNQKGAKSAPKSNQKGAEE